MSQKMKSLRLLFMLLMGMLFLNTWALAAEKNITTDVVVVGAGGSGSAAAYAAAQGGAKVILLEKQPAVGGTGNNAEGMFAVESSMQREKNINITTDEAFKMIVEYSHWRANARLVRAFINKSADSVDWLQKNGVKFKEVTTHYPGGLMTWHIFDGRGAAVIKNFHSKFPSMGVEVYKETPGKKLIIENGKVAGVVAEDIDGNILNIRSKAVIIATGGFGNNTEMLEKYARYPKMITVGNKGKTGDGIQMAWSAGADKVGLDVMMSYRPGLPGYPTDSHLLAMIRQPYLWVNSQGERFCDESVIFQWPYAGNALESNGGEMYAVFDEGTKNYVMKDKGIDVGVGVMVPVTAKLTRLDTEMKDAESKGYAFRAKSLKELAKKIGADEKLLLNTIDEYNKSYDDKHDKLFAKDRAYIQPVKTGPFYAIKAMPMTLGSLGGVRVNDKMQALDKNRKVIDGLYVIGNDAGGLYGDSYELIMGGSTISFAINSGRIAAENVIKNLK